MKKLVMILFAMVLAFAVNAQNIALRSSNTGITKSVDNFSGFQATFSFNQIESTTIVGTEKGTFSALTIAGTYQCGELGMPLLPVFKKMIAIPVGATPKVVVKNFTTAEYNLNEYGIKTILPAQPDVRKDQEPEDVPFAYDAKAYNMDEYNHSVMAEVEVLGTMRGIIVGMLYVNPVQYNPVNHSVMVYNDIEVEVTFENGDYQKTQELYRNTYSPYFAEMYKVVFNGKDMYDDHPDLYNTPVRMLVIANRMFESTLEPWLEWKTQKGFILDVNYTDVIGQTAAAIKTFCHQKYNDGATNGTAPTFIVFVGDTPQLPASKTGSQSLKATDLDYARVNTGSYWFPDMYYSRMSAQNPQQLENIIEKILYYEKYEFADPTYLDNVVLIAGWDSYWTPKVGAPQVNYANTYYYNAAHGYANIHKYTNPYTGCYTHWDNIGFANYTAHCGESNWSDPSYSQSQIASQNNLNKYYVAMGNCCLAADFGWSGNTNFPNECFGETMIRAQKKGAVGYIGSSPSSYWGGDFHFAVGAYAGNIETVTNPTLENTRDGLYDMAFRDADFNCLSSLIYGGNLSVTYAHSNGYTTHVHANYYWEAYNVLGDGSLMPFNSQGANNNVSHMPVIYIGLPTYEVNAEPGSYVAISKDGELLGTAVANESGVATVTLASPITSGGDVMIVVTRNQYKPYINTVQAVAQSGSYVTATMQLSSESVPYSGATVFLDVNLKNVGVETATGISMNITTESNDVTIITGTATLDNLEVDGEETLEQIFKVEIKNYLQDETPISFNLNIISDNNEFQKTVKVVVLAPKLALTDILVSKTAGGIIAPGDEVNIDFDVTNVGHDGIADVFATVLSFYSGFELLDNEQTITQINAGETQHITFTGKVGDAVEDGSLIPIHFYAYKGVYSTETIGYVVVGSAMEDFETGDFSLFNWVQGTNPWEITTSNVYQGTYSARSKTNLAHSAASTLEMTTYTPSASTVSYARNASSENNYDWFRFYIDGVQKEQLSGTSNSWAMKSFDVPAGTHTFKFEYSKDGSVNQGSDCAWIDNITIPGMATMVTEDLPQVKVMDHTVEGLIDDIMVGEAQITFDLKNIGLIDAEGIIAELSYDSNSNSQLDIFAENSGSNQELPFSLNANEEKSILFNLVCLAIDKSEIEDIKLMLKIEIAGMISYYSVVIKCMCTAPFEPEFCEAPTNLEGTNDEDTAILTWGEPENIDGVFLGYNVYRDGSETPLNEDLLEELGYNDEGLEIGTYTYQVAAVYEHCDEALTESVSVTIGVGITDFQTASYKLYPNPAKNELNIEVYDMRYAICDVEIYDVYGRISYISNLNSQVSSLKIDISQLASGMYFVKIISEQGSVIKKVAVE